MPFESPDWRLEDLLREVGNGKIQLPDFQREFKWEDPRIASLLATVSRGYPIGVVMMLETGGDGSRFKWRPLSGVAGATDVHPEQLLLDGQQRLTSLYQVFRSGRPVETTDTRNKALSRWYYVDIALALASEGDREEAIVSVGPDRTVREDFGRRVVADYSTTEMECAAGMFPLGIAFDGSAREDWSDVYKDLGPEQRARWKDFREGVLREITNYVVPVIRLTKQTPKEAVCIVFEKVNTGGVPLNVFELLTATFAGDPSYYREHGHDFELAEDWRDAKTRLDKHVALQSVQNTDFLQALSLLVTRQRRIDLLAADETIKAPPISCKRADMLKLTLAEYLRWRDPLVEAFEWCAQFLTQQYVFRAKDLPYPSQLVPLAALRTVLGARTDHHSVADRIARWYWSGVLGELYGGTTETRFGRDVDQVPRWLDGGEEPETVQSASFHERRLLTLRSRQSAAYKGVHALLMRGGCEDWLKKQRLDVAHVYDLRIDIHHVFPKDWCIKNKIDTVRRESIVNKTPLAFDTNRIIGKHSPADYLPTIERRSGLEPSVVDGLVRTHRIAPEHLRSGSFDDYFEDRRNALVELIAAAMGKPVVRTAEAPDAENPQDFGEIDHSDEVNGTPAV
ncbi:GmrSD restriction endonuclease domain-containing protein [Pseudonocardia saturnea]